MILLRLFEFSAVALILIILVTQIIFPFIRGTKIFPIFRKEAVLIGKLEEAKQRKVEREIKKEIEKVNKQSH
jgi:hypothetical protein